jgi:hypothetical protein
MSLFSAAAVLFFLWFGYVGSFSACKTKANVDE